MLNRRLNLELIVIRPLTSAFFEITAGYPPMGPPPNFMHPYPPYGTKYLIFYVNRYILRGNLSLMAHKPNIFDFEHVLQRLLSLPIIIKDHPEEITVGMIDRI